MKVFVTGASGFIGQAVVKELINHGHQVVGLVRSDKSASIVHDLGGDVLWGDLDDVSALAQGARDTDGTIHLAFVHDFNDFHKGCATDQAAIRTMGEALKGTGKPLIIASGTGAVQSDGNGIAHEDSPPMAGNPFALRHESAAILRSLSKEHDIRGVVIRLPPTVHDQGDPMFVATIISLARKNGKVVYVGDGLNRWTAGHRKDVATLFRLALEKGKAGATYTGCSELAIPMIDIVTLISQRLGLPLESLSREAAESFLGIFAMITTLDGPTSSEKTQKELGWTPSNIGLLADMDLHYF